MDLIIVCFGLDINLMLITGYVSNFFSAGEKVIQHGGKWTPAYFRLPSLNTSYVVSPFIHYFFLSFLSLFVLFGLCTDKIL